MKPSLLILAAGGGSRFGALKQLEPLGPHSETIMEYSIYDAVKAGFGKVVMIIRREFLRDFETRFSKYKDRIEIVYAFQEINPKFEGIENIALREKPWGTVQAVLSASKQISEPFAVINADDFYGRKVFQLMSKFLKNRCSENNWSMIGYQLKNTLSEHGGVTRGVCEADKDGFLLNVKECREIQKNGTEIYYKEGDTKILLKEDAIVSMNFWGFHPHFFELADREFQKFLSEHSGNSKVEMTLPDFIQPVISGNRIKVSILKTGEKWIGITYREDAALAAKQLPGLKV